MTEIEKKKKFLMSYQAEKKRVRRLGDQLEELQLNNMFPLDTNDGMPYGTDKENVSDYVVKADKIKGELAAARYHGIQAFQTVQRCIEGMESDQEKDLLTYRYLEGLKWEEVCMRIGYSWRHTHRIHAKALENLKLT